MRHQSQTSTSSGRATPQPATGGSRWLVLAVSLCGALAGASIVEALAALTSRSNAPITPDHLIAAPLALAGALCGGLLAAVLVSRDRGTERSRVGATTDAPISADILPGEPLLWQPTPVMISRIQPEVSAATQTSRATLRARRIRRAIRQHGYGHHPIHGSLARPVTHR